MSELNKSKIFEMLKDDTSTEEEVLSAITDYKEKHPFDMDVFFMESDFYMQTGDLERAKSILEDGCFRYPYNAKIHYMSAKVYEIMNDIVHAIMRYTQFLSLYEFEDDVKGEVIEKQKKLTKRMESFADEIVNCEKDPNRIAAFLNIIEWMNMGMADGFGKREIRFRGVIPIIGKYYYADETQRKYVGAYRSYIQLGKGQTDLINACGEFRSVKEKNEYVTQCEKGIIPIAIKQEDGILTFKGPKEKEIKLKAREANTFYYYRVEEGTRIYSDNKMFIGKEIPIRHDTRKKRLVISIFVDGLAQHEIMDNGLCEYMPNTYAFFGKKGVVCTKAYCTGEWTLPSISGIMSGINTLEHRVFHNTIDCAIPCDVVTLAERFQAEGYYTYAINGNWRIVPCYGMDRGFDSFLYQHQLVNWKVEHIVGDAIDHLKAFKETDQYLWLSIGDLHDVADEFALPISVQTEMPVEQLGFDDSGYGTSVKQGYSTNKKKQYEKMLKHVDDYLGLLYEFILDNYSDDEIVISLFSDHGQGFLIPSGKEFFSDERSKVAMMFRDGVHINENEDELLSTLDYGEILCEMAGVKTGNVRSEGQIPKFLDGASEREFALTESIHPGDFYQARLTYRDCVYHFINRSPVLFDGRFKIGEYDAYIKNPDGEVIENDDLCRKSTNWILKHIARYIMTE